jgi:hypothetical protein
MWSWLVTSEKSATRYSNCAFFVPVIVKMEAHLTNEELDELSALAEVRLCTTLYDLHSSRNWILWAWWYQSDQFHVVPEQLGNDTYSTASTQDLMRRGDPDAPFAETSNAAPTPFLVTIVAKIFQLLRPILAIILSPRVQRTVIRTTFLTIALSWILGVACSAYIAFYMAHVPKTAHIEPVYLQYE